jgi:hypothetical protein
MYFACRSLEITHGCSVNKKAKKKESGEATRDSVKKEMAMSRIAESGRAGASTLPAVATPVRPLRERN